MKLAYLIMAHKNPAQLRRLIQRLDCADADFFIHIDKKYDERPFRAALAGGGKGAVRFVSRRIGVHWGGFSQVEAAISCLSAALGSGNKFDYLLLMSGQDYPLKRNEDIFAFFESAGSREFLEYAPLTDTGKISWSGEFSVENRIERYNFIDILSGDRKMNNKLKRILNALIPRRRFPAGLVPYGGSQWWRITSACGRYILDTVDNNPAFRKFFRWTFIPDEIFFHTIVLNSRFAENAVNDNLTYIDWKGNARPPKVLGGEDLERIIGCGKLFARKFDIEYDGSVLDSIDGRM